MKEDFETFNWDFSGEIGGFEREESTKVIRDTEWATRNVMLGFDIAGMSFVKKTMDFFILAASQCKDLPIPQSFARH